MIADRHVYEYTCDECGAFEEEEHACPRSRGADPLPRGWEMVDDRLLCEECLREQEDE